MTNNTVGLQRAYGPTTVWPVGEQVIWSVCVWVIFFTTRGPQVLIHVSTYGFNWGTYFRHTAANVSGCQMSYTQVVLDVVSVGWPEAAWAGAHCNSLPFGQWLECQMRLWLKSPRAAVDRLQCLDLPVESEALCRPGTCLRKGEPT